jgi:hypothetical protein
MKAVGLDPNNMEAKQKLETLRKEISTSKSLGGL